LAVNLVLMALGVVFGGLAVAIVAYGRSRVRQAPKTTAKPAAPSVTKPAAVSMTRPAVTTGKPRPSEKFCEKCYAVISDDLEFCSECGARQT
jgi:hypothetical protein